VRRVAETSNAMDLPPGIFTWSPRAIARGLKAAVLRSPRTKGTKFQSAMSMLNLYINRAGRKLAAADRRRLEAAKDELRRVFGRPARGARPGRTAGGRARPTTGGARPARRQAA
jgi:hypothetical protein